MRTAIYIIESTSGHFKIGISDDPKRRLEQLSMTQGPYEYSLVFYWRCSSRAEARYIEKRLHGVYDSKRVRGEWFLLDSKDLVSMEQSIDLLRYKYDPDNHPELVY